MSIRVSHLTKTYGEQKAVDNISFQVKAGEIVGLLGPNGAGKSTTMRILSCFTLPTSGSAEIYGKKILEEPLEVRKKIGYLPENNPLYDEMYVAEYLHFVSKLFKYSKKNASQKVREMIDITGLSPEKHKKIGALSKGYRQRVGLAQALLHDPEVLILDEPTSGLDPNQIVEIRNLIKNIGKTKTVILSSHIMQEVQAMCNRVIIINKGKIVADDHTDLLLKKSAGKNALLVSFKKNVNKNELEQIPGISDVRRKGEYWYVASQKKDIAEKVFQFAVETDNVILEMINEKEDLEQIFQQLTVSQS